MTEWIHLLKWDFVFDFKYHEDGEITVIGIVYKSVTPETDDCYINCKAPKEGAAVLLAGLIMPDMGLYHQIKEHFIKELTDEVCRVEFKVENQYMLCYVKELKPT